MSLPVWECGLKHSVEPHQILELFVTPRVGVWIETQYGLTPQNLRSSLPVWECGLKHFVSSELGESERHSPCGSVD